VLFHWSNGFFFEGQPDGGVIISKAAAGFDSPKEILMSIPAAEWVSIVHAMAHPSADFYTVESVLQGGPLRLDYTLERAREKYEALPEHLKHRHDLGIAL
jgi:hypothetical protein